MQVSRPLSTPHVVSRPRGPLLTARHACPYSSSSGTASSARVKQRSASHLQVCKPLTRSAPARRRQPLAGRANARTANGGAGSPRAPRLSRTPCRHAAGSWTRPPCCLPARPRRAPWAACRRACAAPARAPHPARTRARNKAGYCSCARQPSPFRTRLHAGGCQPEQQCDGQQAAPAPARKRSSDQPASPAAAPRQADGGPAGRRQQPGGVNGCERAPATAGCATRAAAGPSNRMGAPGQQWRSPARPAAARQQRLAGATMRTYQRARLVGSQPGRC